eukprot:SAG25_NODE_822_length_5182_cov_9.225324_2_plen_111_part_00
MYTSSERNLYPHLCHVTAAEGNTSHLFHSVNRDTTYLLAGMQSWIRDLIDLKTQISVLQNCMHAASQQPCTASRPLQGCRQCEPWTGATAAIYPATAWPADRVRLRPGYL